MTSQLKKTRKTKGFTLIELLVVVAVLALLASIVFSNLGGAREGARISNALSFESQTHSLLGSDLVGWWKLDDNLSDTSGYGNNGIWGGAGSPTYVDGVPGKGGKAVEFDGGNYITFGDSHDLDGHSKFSITFWMFTFDHSPTSRRIFSKESSNPNGRQGWLIYYRGDRSLGLERWYNGSRTGADAVTPPLGLNAFHHITFVYDGERLHAYHNDRLVSTSTVHSQGVLNHEDPFAIGVQSNSLGGAKWLGLIDDVRVYSRALSAQETKIIYAQTKDRYLANE